jgi:hypothetical protein
MLNFLAALGKGQACLREEPFLGLEGIILATNNVSQRADFLAVRALNHLVDSRDALSNYRFRGRAWNRAEGSSGIEGDQALTSFDRFANIERLAVDLYVVEFDAEHVLFLDKMPLEVTGELGLVVVAECQIRLASHVRLFLFCRQVESKHVARQKTLVYHLIENGSDTFLGKSWVSQTNDCVEVFTTKDAILFLDVSKLLLLDVNLAARHAIAGAQADIIINEVSL